MGRLSPPGRKITARGRKKGVKGRLEVSPNMALSSQQIEQRIQRIKTQLAALGEMRPGSLSKQYNVCGKPGCRCKDPKHPQRHGPYYQLSWVHRGKSTTQFIRRPFVAQVKTQ